MNKSKIKELLGIDNPTILEIGANDGSDSEEFLQTFDNITLHCFEPDPRAIKAFELRICHQLRLGYNARVYLHKIALCDVDGEMQFWVSDSDPNCKVGPDWNKSGSIKKPTNHLLYHPWCKFDTQITVKTMRLDTWSKDAENIDFIWADVQGAEENLIVGGLETLKRTKYFYTEYSPVPMYDGDSSISKITGLLPDFELVEIIENNLLLRNKNV